MSSAKKAKVDSNAAPAEEDPIMNELREIQNSLEEVNQQCMDEIVEIEKKFNLLKRPHFQSRAKAINKIDHFWLNTLQAHPQFSAIIGGPQDEEALQALTELDVEDKPDVKSGYMIHLTFADNPFFTNTKLTKTIDYDEEGNMTVTNTEISWKPGKNLTNHENGNSKKRSEPEIASFFDWWCDTEDAELCDLIRDDIWPNPVKFFLGEFSDDEGQVFEDDGEDDDDAGEVDLDGASGDE